MPKVEWWINCGYAGCTYRGTWDVPEGTTDEELEEWMQNEMANCLDCGFARVEEEE